MSSASYLKRLISAGLSAAAATRLVSSCEHATKTLPLISTLTSQAHFEKQVERHQQQLIQFEGEQNATQQANQSSLQQQTTNLQAALKKTNEKIADASNDLLSGLKLDISLEDKRLADCLKAIEAEYKELEAYAIKISHEWDCTFKSVKMEVSRVTNGFIGSICLIYLFYILNRRRKPHAA